MKITYLQVRIEPTAVSFAARQGTTKCYVVYINVYIIFFSTSWQSGITYPIRGLRQSGNLTFQRSCKKTPELTFTILLLHYIPSYKLFNCSFRTLAVPLTNNEDARKERCR